MHIHILGICGTFMGGIALLARAHGHTVTGSDANVYPPMSTQLEEAGITLRQGYLPEHLMPAPDQVVIGNAMSRGNAAVEYVLDQGLPYTSGPQWLAEHVLNGQTVLAVAGTHGKTSTSSMLAWILEHAGLAPGFLIGGIPQNFGVSARDGGGRYFVVEADEYDTAFFDKRSKFVHYHPRVAILNNLEFDHADIFADLAAIQTQFHHLVRTIPGNGAIIRPHGDTALDAVIQQGCWTPIQSVGIAAGDWQVRLDSADGSIFSITHTSAGSGQVKWSLIGRHNVMNGIAAIAAAYAVGVDVDTACTALASFRNARRRMELRGEVNDIRVYDDFAHHPTAIATTLAGARAHAPQRRLLAVLEPRSNTMRMGVHQHTLADALGAADQVILHQPDALSWDLAAATRALGDRVRVLAEIPAIIDRVAEIAAPGDDIIVMSNGGFGGIHDKLLDRLQQT